MNLNRQKALPSATLMKERRSVFSRLLVTRAFSLIEILVVVALLSVIMIALIAMFNQTRKAFTAGLTQGDVLESGRSAADLIAREIEQMSASGGPLNINFFLSTPPEAINGFQQRISSGDSAAVENRTNYLQEVYFLTRLNQTWAGIGYKLDNYSNGLGSLYRYSTTNLYTSNMLVLTNQATNFLTAYSATSSNYFSKIIDGVVDFRVRVFDTNGTLLIPITNNYYSSINGNILGLGTNANTGELTYTMMEGSILPAYIEIELGVLEDRALARYNTLAQNPVSTGNTPAAYLSNHAAQVHIFRQHIPIRNVNAAAYP